MMIASCGGCRVAYGASPGQIGNIVDMKFLVSLHIEYNYHYS